MVKSKNIEFIAYLRLHDVKIVEVNKVAKGRAEYLLEVDPKEYDAHKIIFEQSDFKKFYDNLKSVRELAY